jgi:hypothetical protein
MDRPIGLLGDRDMRPEGCLAWTQQNPIHLAGRLPRAIDPKTPFDPNAPMPPQLGQMLHQLGVCKPTLRGQDDTAPAPGRPLSPAAPYTPHTRHYCWDVPTRSTRFGRPIHGTRARDAPENGHPTTSTYPGPDTRPGCPTPPALVGSGAHRVHARRSDSFSSQRAHRRAVLCAYTAWLCT